LVFGFCINLPNERSVLMKKSGVDDLVNKKEKVLETALEMLAEGGFHASPVSVLAKRSGVAVGTIYHHFENKESMVEELYMNLKRKMADAMIKGLDVDGTFYEKFMSVWMGLFRHYTQNPMEYGFLEQYHHSPYISRATVDKSEVFYQPVVQFFANGIKEGYIRKMDVVILTEYLYAMVTTAVRIHLAQSKPTLNKRQLNQLIEMSWAAVKV
jgi:AcrR family transcriptional regulator